jgi:Integral peroxisomal membrane peroxin
VIFLVQNKIEDVLAWRNPVETISGMTIYSLVIINPQILLSLPFFVLMFALLIPSYQARHPAAPRSLSDAPTEVTESIAPVPQPVKPAPELSRDFFMNMRDIQNSMDDFNNLYDIVREFSAHYTSFRNEALSSTLLAFSAIGVIFLLMFMDFLPFRWIMIFIGNSVILAGNSKLWRYITSTYLTVELVQRVRQQVLNFVEEDYIPPPPPRNVVLIVEIFESQRLLPPASSNPLPEWSSSKFSTFPPQSANQVTKLSSVAAPPGYVFTGEGWNVDEKKGEWSMERGMNDESGFWFIDEAELEEESDGWVLYSANGWKVRRLTREVMRRVIKS